MAIALDQFLRRIADSGLLTEADVKAFVDALPEKQKPADGEQLARLLVKHKKLTAYQAQEVYKGAGKGLVLGNYVVHDKLGQGAWAWCSRPSTSA